MSEEQFKIEKEFLKAEMSNIPLLQRDLGNAPFIEYIEFLSKFKTYLIEQGEHVLFDVSVDLISNILRLQSVIKELETNNEDHTLNRIRFVNRIKELEKEVHECADEYCACQAPQSMEAYFSFKAGMKKAIEMMQSKVDLSSTGDIICHQCHNSNPAWYAPNDLFNLINGSPNGILCPLCFQKKADEKGINIIFTVEVLPEPPKTD